MTKPQLKSVPPVDEAGPEADSLLNEILAGKRRGKLADFDMLLAHFAQEVAVHAIKLPKQQHDMRLETFKALTAYKAMLNRATEGDEGKGISDIREALERPAPETSEEDPDGGTEDA